MDPFKTDPDLLEHFRRGDAAALERVYRAFFQPLRNFVLRGFAFKSGTRDLYFRGQWAEHDLDDVVQETFRRAFGVKARQSYDGVRPYKNYLFTIARNAVINDLAARTRQIPVGEALTRDGPGEGLQPFESWVAAQQASYQAEIGPTVEEQIEHLEVFGLVSAFIETLARDEHRLFELRFLAGLSQEKSARRLGWNRARVRKLEARLRRAFLAHVHGTGYLERRGTPRTARRLGRGAAFERAREIWRAARAETSPEIWSEAA